MAGRLLQDAGLDFRLAPHGTQSPARNPRYIPPDSLVEVTCRTIHGRFLLLPGRDLNAIIIGALAKAQQRYGMVVCGLVYLSNHCHLLLQPRNARQLARFMNYVNSKIAREAGRLHWWREKLWGRRYGSVIVSDEPEEERARLRYLLAQGCKEGLVESPKQWPGATSAQAHSQGWKLSGLWFDRTAEHKARKRGEHVPKLRFAEALELVITPIPSWRDEPEHRIDARVRALVREIEDETREEIRRTGRQPLGRQAILEQHPHAQPASFEPSPAPRFHAHRCSVRRRLENAFRRFLHAYREASSLFRQGKEATFPPGSFLPSPGFNPAPG